MAVRRVCSKMASRSNVRAFLPGRNKDISLNHWHKQHNLLYIKGHHSLYIPNPENPITDAMSPSPLILSDTKKQVSVIYLYKFYIATPTNVFLVHFSRSLCRLNVVKAQLNFVNRFKKWLNIIQQLRWLRSLVCIFSGQVKFIFDCKALYCRIRETVKESIMKRLR